MASTEMASGKKKKKSTNPFNWNAFYEFFPDANEDTFPRFQFLAGGKTGWQNYQEPAQVELRKHYNEATQDPGVHQ